MADLDFRTRNEFKKGSRIRLIDEDPTFLSFLILFHFDDHPDVGHSPLLDGTAERYLQDVIRREWQTPPGHTPAPAAPLSVNRCGARLPPPARRHRDH